MKELILILVIVASYIQVYGQSEIKHKLKIGDPYQGGIIFYIDESGDHALIAAPYDQSKGVEWGCSGMIIGASGLTDGKSNTAKIVKYCGYNTAAYICDTLTIGGYSDWYLPSQYELNKMYEHAEVIKNLSSAVYCSSTEYTLRENRFNSWNQNFGQQGKQFPWDKNRLYYVRAIRNSANDSLPKLERKTSEKIPLPVKIIDELTIEKAKIAPNRTETKYYKIANVMIGDVVKYLSPYGDVIFGIVAEIKGSNKVIIKTYPSQGSLLTIEENYKNLLKIEF